MSVAKFEITNSKELALLNKFFARRYPDHEGTPVKVYVYPSFKRPVEMKVVRYVLADGSAVSYNLPAGLYEIFKNKIREERWDWMVRPNGIKELQNYSVGREERYQSLGNRHIINNYLMNVNLASYTLPESVFTQEEPLANAFEGLHSGDFHHIDLRFQKVANITTDTIRQIRANLTLIANDMNTVKDHDLYFGFFIDKDNFKLAPALSRIEPHLPEGGTFTLEQQPLNPADFAYLTSLGQTAIETIQRAVDRLNQAIQGFFKEADRHPLLLAHAEDMITTTFVMLTQAGHMVYTFTYEGGKTMVDALANDILDRLSKLDGVVGLDINSWRVWDYTNPADPVRVNELDFESEIYNRYTDSFVTALYGYLITLTTPLLRPYSRREAVAPEHVKDHAIGSIRMA
ncbi:hypothetical protein NFI00_000169 [Salmonella enterica]|nr:hypothetical protein [Salmonella enterica]